MKILPEPVAFEWDQGNFDKNFTKHFVTTQEAEEVFLNEPFTVNMDTAHSTKSEQRYQALGKTKAGRRLFAAFTIRGNKIRVISIRDMSKKEEHVYEKLENHS